ncbi:MAG: alpha/beta fold hydrolase [Bacteroidia bacterium]
MSSAPINENSPIYAIPGMGVDGRIFKNLQLDRPIQILEWMDPLGERESLQDYAKRLAKPLPDQPFLMMGLSFGGVVCQEIARFKPVQGVVLLSSIRDKTGRPWHMDLMRRIPYYLLSKGDWRIKTMPYWGPLFGLTDKSEITFLQDLFSGFNVLYRMWAIRQLVHWQKSTEIEDLPIFHIHGSKDEIFPVRLQQTDRLIKGGTHSMVFQRSEEVSAAIQEGIKYIESRT